MDNDRGIYILEYVPGIREVFIYAFSEPEERILMAESIGYTRRDLDSFNGLTTGNTISRRTIELILNGETEWKKNQKD